MIEVDEEKFDDAILRLLLAESNIRENWRPYVADRLKDIRLQLKESVGKKDSETIPLTHELNYEWMWNELEKWMREQERFGNNLQQALGNAYLGVMQKIETAAQQKRVPDAGDSVS